MSNPKPEPTPKDFMTPMALALFVLSIAALGASVLVLTVANQVATRPAPSALARADSLARVVVAIRESLVVERRSAGILPVEIEGLQRRGLASPVDSLKADLARHRELIPYPGVLGGTMGFYAKDRILVLDDRWVFARFEDGHVGGSLLAEYAVKDGRITWRRVASTLR